MLLFVLIALAPCGKKRHEKTPSLGKQLGNVTCIASPSSSLFHIGLLELFRTEGLHVCVYVCVLNRLPA